MLYRILLASTNTGDIVLDPFFSSGTTGAVARKLGRHFIGIEREHAYVKIARKRNAAVKALPDKVLELSEPKNRSRIPFGRLLEAGLLQPGETLYFLRDHSISGLILANGTLQVGSCIGCIHSIAKSILHGSPANGWELWLYKERGVMKPISELRKKLVSPRIANVKIH